MTSALILRIVCEELLSGMLLGYSIARLIDEVRK